MLTARPPFDTKSRSVRPNRLALLRPILLTLVLLMTMHAANAAERSTEAHYTLDMTHGADRLFYVECRFPERAGTETVLTLPVWSPGSYLIREYAKNLSHFEAFNADGDTLRFEKFAKDRWRIEHADGDDLVIRYRIYGGELTVRTPYITSLRAEWQTTSVFVAPLDEELSAWTIRTVVPEGWTSDVIATKIPGDSDTWRGSGHDRFYDTVGMAGPLTTWPFEIGGVPHRLVFDGDGNYKQDEILPLVEAGMREVEKVWRGDMELVDGRSPALPVDDYGILTVLDNQGGGGLEHIRGTLLLWERWSLKSRWDRMRFATLCVHEYFHFWNVKSIRPNHFYHYHYDQENYTRNLFEIEGFTSYYDVLLTGRGLATLDDAGDWVTDWLKLWEREIQTHEGYPGKDVQNLREASFEAWIKFYRRDENYANHNIHYYRKGALVAALLDASIRAQSNDEKSLDDVMHQLWVNHLETGAGYDVDGVRNIIEDVTGFDPTEFWERFVTGTDPLPYEDLWLNRIGFKLEEPEDNAWLGVDFTTKHGQVICKTVHDGGPAETAGLSNGDELVAIDGWRVLAASGTADWNYQERITALDPGDTMTVTLAREGKLMERTLTAAVNPAKVKLKPVDEPSDEQVAAFRAWCGLPHPGEKDE